MLEDRALFILEQRKEKHSVRSIKTLMKKKLNFSLAGKTKTIRENIYSLHMV